MKEERAQSAIIYMHRVLENKAYNEEQKIAIVTKFLLRQIIGEIDNKTLIFHKSVIDCLILTIEDKEDRFEDNNETLQEIVKVLFEYNILQGVFYRVDPYKDSYIFHEDNEVTKWRIRENLTFFGAHNIFQFYKNPLLDSDGTFFLLRAYCPICTNYKDYWPFPSWPQCCDQEMILPSQWF